ncbi:MAG TPA: RNA 2',3'-cyclic phosphodiesterase, partial [Smithellaceae bacterium]|nr:RNA 2',3'-cyclic phosphodiesterase [Smithellaceae bacterium]
MTDGEKNIRAFLAIEPPEEILAAASRLQEKLKRELTGKVSWTRPHGNHLTLKFFGDISQNDVANICNAVRQRAAAVLPILLTVRQMGVFPNPQKARVLWLGTEGEVEKLAQLQKQLEDDFARIGFPQETRPFRAHLTLGRIKFPGSV